jgi:hypothetical protein
MLFRLVALVLCFSVFQPSSELWAKTIKLRIVNQNSLSGSPDPASLFNVQIVPKGEADLIWDLSDGSVLTGKAEAAAENIGASQIQDVVNKWLAVAAVEELQLTAPLQVSFKPEAEHYTIGDKVELSSAPPAYSHAVAFNLASTGEVQLLYPQRDDPPRLESGARYSLLLNVGPPLGADHLVVIASEKPLSRLIAKLPAATAADIPTLLRDALSGGGYQIGMKALFTSAKP